MLGNRKKCQLCGSKDFGQECTTPAAFKNFMRQCIWNLNYKLWRACINTESLSTVHGYLVERQPNRRVEEGLAQCVEAE